MLTFDWFFQDTRKVWVAYWDGGECKCTRYPVQPHHILADLRELTQYFSPQFLKRNGVDPADLDVYLSWNSEAPLPLACLVSNVDAGDSDRPFVLRIRGMELGASGLVQAAPPGAPSNRGHQEPLGSCPRRGCSNNKKTCEDGKYKINKDAKIPGTVTCCGDRPIKGHQGTRTCNTNLHPCCGKLWPDDTRKSFRHHLRECHSQQGSLEEIVPASVAVQSQHDAPINKRLYEQSQHDAPNKRPCSPRPSTLPNAYGIQEPSVDLDPRPPLGLPSPLPTSSHGSPNSAPSDVGLPPPDDIPAAPNDCPALPFSTPAFDDDPLSPSEILVEAPCAVPFQ